MMRFSPLVLVLPVLALSACSSRPDGPPGGPGMMGGRTPTSLAGEPVGRPSSEEAVYAMAVVEWAKSIDANHDGSLSADEVKVDVARFIALLDTDKDGAVNARELSEYRMARQAALRQGGPNGAPDGAPGGQGPDGQGDDRSPPDGGARGSGGDRPAGGPPGGGRGGPGGPGGGMGMGGAGEDKVMAADRNLDFRVTVEELQALALVRFQVWDTDKDNLLSLKEVEAGAAKQFHERIGMGGPGGGMGGGRGGGRGGPPGGG